VADPTDRDRVRFGLTGEAGLNDGTAFPFVMLGLGLLGRHDLGAGGWRWWAVDLVWAVGAGLVVGAGLGTLVARAVLYLRRTHREAVGLDDFLALGLIGLSYGVAVLAHAYGFLAVFAAGLALRRVEMKAGGDGPPPAVATAAREGEKAATDPATAPAFMAGAVLAFNEQVERVAEVAVVVLLGAMLAAVPWPPAALWFLPLLLLVVRPVAVLAGLVGTRLTPLQRALMAWFGIRGVGSVYYLAFALTHGLADDTDLAGSLAGLTLLCVATSVVVHGVSVTPLMAWYARSNGRR
jgi:NhaP-type Na+/H+ or K+/H+ antiporter